MSDTTPFEEVVYYTCTECNETYDIDYLEKDDKHRTICPICDQPQQKHIVESTNDSLDKIYRIREGRYSGDSLDDAEIVEFIFTLTDAEAANLLDDTSAVNLEMLEEAIKAMSVFDDEGEICVEYSRDVLKEICSRYNKRIKE